MPSKKLKAGTWNVNSIKVRLTRLVPFLEREKLDFLCLQELKCEESAFPFDALMEIGYHAAVFGQKTYNGVAILSKKPLTHVQNGFGDGEEDPAARMIGCVNEDGIYFYSAYVPNGQEVGADKYFYKLKWLERFRNYFRTKHTEADKVIVAGDFNVAPEDRDVHDPELWRGKILCSDRERKRLRDFEALGYTDLFRKFEARPGFYTWWDYRNLGFQKNLGLRIDMIYASNTLANHCDRVDLFREERKGEKPSDHIPVVAQFSV